LSVIITVNSNHLAISLKLVSCVLPKAKQARLIKELDDNNDKQPSIGADAVKDGNEDGTLTAIISSGPGGGRSIKIPDVDDVPEESPVDGDGPARRKASLRSNKKVYPKYNIVVEPLTKIQDPRASAALSFKEKRLGKVPRENCGKSLLSYREKMLVRNS
jgi:hypothetical protein